MIKPQGEVSKVSVAIGTWNRIDMVRFTIHAALNQTMRPYEIVVFDDNSPDETYSLLKDEFKDFKSVKFYKQKVNTGGVPNWNAAINACSGDYIAWCSDDDQWFIHHLQNAIDFLANPDNHSVGMTHSSFCTIFESANQDFVKFPRIDENILEEVSKSSTRGNKVKIVSKENVLNYYLKFYNYPFHPSTLVFRREVWEAVGEFNDEFELADTDWFLRVSKLYDVAYLPHYGVLNRRHEGNWSNKMGSVQMQREQYYMVASALQLLPFSLNKLWLTIAWKALFNQILIRIYISRSRGGYYDASMASFTMLKDINYSLRILPKTFYFKVGRILYLIINFLQKIIFPNSLKYNSFGKSSPE